MCISPQTAPHSPKVARACRHAGAVPLGITTWLMHAALVEQAAWEVLQNCMMELWCAWSSYAVVLVACLCSDHWLTAVVWGVRLVVGTSPLTWAGLRRWLLGLATWLMRRSGTNLDGWACAAVQNLRLCGVIAPPDKGVGGRENIGGLTWDGGRTWLGGQSVWNKHVHNTWARTAREGRTRRLTTKKTVKQLPQISRVSACNTRQGLAVCACTQLRAGEWVFPCTLYVSSKRGTATGDTLTTVVIKSNAHLARMHTRVHVCGMYVQVLNTVFERAKSCQAAVVWWCRTGLGKTTKSWSSGWIDRTRNVNVFRQQFIVIR